jgi:hypothetical protein
MATQRDDEQSSPTSVNDIVEELSDLQEHLGILRLTQPNMTTRDVLRLDASIKMMNDADSDLLEEYPPDRDEELMGGLPFQAFESKRDSPEDVKASAFATLMDVLAQQEPPGFMEDAFVDEGVRIRRFGSDGDGPGSPDSSFSIVVEEDWTPTHHSPATKGCLRKINSNKSKSKTAMSMARDAMDGLPRRTKVDISKSATTACREGPEASPPLVQESQAAAALKPSKKQQQLQTSRYSPDLVSGEIPPRAKSRREQSRPLPTTVQVADSTRKSFSIRGALGSLRRSKSASPTASEEEVLPGTKSVRFSKNLVSSVQYRPKTLPEEMEALYFSKEELDELERDRDERIYEEQFEVVTGRDPKDIAVSYPIRRIERPPPPEPKVEEPPVILPPGLLDISGSWSSTSEENQDSFEI